MNARLALLILFGAASEAGPSRIVAEAERALADALDRLDRHDSVGAINENPVGLRDAGR